ncbi:MAG: hypothetical protein FWG65_07275 [Turicibacter sp.]|nr:hypothetical protein [Turicibacter sp.]
MYEILENQPKMTNEEIHEKYEGKWLFVVKERGDQYDSLDDHIPVVVADTAWEGSEEGIYEVYLRDPQWITAGELSLLPRNPNAIFGGLWEVDVDDCN